MGKLAHGEARQEGDPDAAPVGAPSSRVPVGAEALAQVLERLGTTDLLHAEHVGRELADHPRKLAQLGVVGPLTGGTVSLGGRRTFSRFHVPREFVAAGACLVL